MENTNQKGETLQTTDSVGVTETATTKKQMIAELMQSNPFAFKDAKNRTKQDVKELYDEYNSLKGDDQPSTDSIGVTEMQTVCYKCGEPMNVGHRWYHADQDDLICSACAETTKQTDTSYAGQMVSEMKLEKARRGN